MRVFIVACIVAAAIATGTAVLLQKFEAPASVAFTTSGARI
jgi:hypothetical protein